MCTIYTHYIYIIHTIHHIYKVLIKVILTFSSITQVFIRTVNKYSDTPANKNAGSVTKIGGSARLSIEGTGLIEDDLPQAENQEGSINGLLFPDEVVVELNKCGCSNRTMMITILSLLALTIILIGTAIGVSTSDQGASGAVWIFAFLCLIACIVSCCVRYCAFCQQPRGADE